jgi:hypothetical protein
MQEIMPEIIRGFTPSNTANDHKYIREHFKKRDITVAMALEQLRQWRNHCDYDDTVAGLTQLLRSAITEAQKIFNRL